MRLSLKKTGQSYVYQFLSFDRQWNKKASSWNDKNIQDNHRNDTVCNLIYSYYYSYMLSSFLLLTLTKYV